jgi:hypothetical protein
MLLNKLSLTAPRCSSGCSGVGTIHRFVALVKWAAPAAILAVLPKCPLCLAAYIAVATGIGVSISTAAYLRISLLSLSIILISVFVLQAMRNLARKFS